MTWYCGCACCNYAHATSHKLNVHASMVNTNTKHISKNVWMACDPKTFWFIQTWMETSNHIWFKCPDLYLWMDAYIYNNMSAIRDKHEQKTYSEHSKSPIRKNVNIHTFELYIFSSKPTDRQGSNLLFHACTQFSKQEVIGQTMQTSQKTVNIFFLKTKQRETCSRLDGVKVGWWWWWW